jgi:hypothetical protein
MYEAEDHPARTQGVKTSYPPSPEVIVQEARHLQELWAEAAYPRRRRAGKALVAAIDSLSGDLERTLRVSLTWAGDAVDPIRDEFQLDDPAAGISLETADSPTKGEQAVAVFLNAVLRENHTDARECILTVQTYGIWEVRIFLSLLLAVSVQGRSG